jgi:alkanesulfonate monooxygenase SsuD/methylene tetrahydromethanopterin reductase-like flavin-dependent oxidoreductase (luciferase family)
VTLPNLEKGARRAGRERTECAIHAFGFVATGATREDVLEERERIREYLGFLYSTPQYAPTLELFDWADVGGRLRELVRAGRWAETKGLVTDEMLDHLVPSAPYAEIADVLREWYGGLADGVSLPMPTDSANEGALRTALESLRSSS